jgi:hypothetical protein
LPGQQKTFDGPIPFVVQPMEPIQVLPVLAGVEPPHVHPALQAFQLHPLRARLMANDLLGNRCRSPSSIIKYAI